jgi:hypothetical protein
MKPIRLVLIGAAVIVVVLLLAVAVAFNSSFQTWVARKTVAKNPAVHLTIGTVDAGLKHVELRDVQLDQNGAVLTLPLLEADVPVLAAGLSRKVTVSRLVAKGWTLDLSRTGGATAATANPAIAAPAAVAAAAKEAFSGIFGGLKLPVDLALDGLQLEGEVVLPAARGRAKLVMAGGGLGAGREAKFDLTGDAALTDQNVSQLVLRGDVVVAMDTPRTFTKLASNLDVAAKGAQFPNGVRLTANVAAARAASGESYSAAMVVADRRLLTVQAEFPTNAQKLQGTWRLDVRDADLAPFALGNQLPTFAAVGEGRFDTDAAFSAVHGSGKLDATAERLERFQSGLAEYLGVKQLLAALGAVKLVADFDVARRGQAIAVDKLDATISGVRPIASVRSLQPFTFDAESGELKAGDPARELVEIGLQGLPLAWAQPFLKDIALTGGDVRGELIATARSRGFNLRAKTPLTIEDLSVAQGGRPLVKNVDVSLPFAADYAPEGWQAETTALTLKTEGAVLMTLDAKVGQLTSEKSAGKAAPAKQPLKATGKLSANLSGLLAQPAVGPAMGLTRGDANVDFVASVGTKLEVQAKVALQNLAADPKVTAEKLPAITADVRADVAEGGQITLNAPVIIERDGRKSDIAIAGTLMKRKDKLTFDAQVTSSNLVVDDAKILAVLAPQASAPANPAEPTKPGAPVGLSAPASNLPPWAGLDGSLKLALKKVVYSAAFQATDVAGTLRLEGGALKFEKLGAVTPDGGEAKLDGAVTFNPKAPQPYALQADVTMKDFDPGPLFHALNPQQPPTIEGKFNSTSRIQGTARTLQELPLSTAGDFQLSSRAGIYRGLPVNVTNAAETTGRVAGWIASAGTAIGALTGKKEYTDYGSKAQALAELATLLRAINYDQLSVVASRDPSLNTTLKNFTLISPEIRLAGGGTITHRPQSDMLNDALAMDFKLRARGHVADLLKYLGVLDPQVDDLGYAACTLPLKVGGTLGKPDTSELNSRLLSLVIEKSGVGDKAGELFNRLIGGGK